MTAIETVKETGLRGDIHPELTYEDYDRLPGWRSSDIRAVNSSGIRAWKRKQEEEFTNKEGLIQGKAFAYKCEDPDGFMRHLEVGPTLGINTKAWIKRQKEVPHLQLVTENMLKKIEAMWKAVSEHDVSGAFWDDHTKLRELSIVFEPSLYPEELFKTRLDWYLSSLCQVVDVKTACQVNRWSVERDIKKFGYILQMAIQREACRSAGLEHTYRNLEYSLLFVETVEKYPEVIVRRVTDEEMDQALTGPVRWALEKLKQYQKTGELVFAVPDVLEPEIELDFEE